MKWDIFWAVVGPVIAVVVSAIFTLCHTSRVQRKTIEQASKERYLADVKKWADRIMNICNLVREDKISRDFESVHNKRLVLIEDAFGISEIRKYGEEFPNAIDAALQELASLPERRVWNEDDVKSLRLCAMLLIDSVATLQYG